MFYFFLGSGTFSQDAFRLIQAVQNGTLNEIIRIHEDLCSVVFSTVSAYSVWFVLHWFTYGASVVLTVIYISEEVHSRTKYHTHTIEFVFLGLILVCFLYQFLFPCFCAARMTSNCTGKIFIELPQEPMMGPWWASDYIQTSRPRVARVPQWGKKAEKSASRTGILEGESRRPPLGSLRSPTFFAVSRG